MAHVLTVEFHAVFEQQFEIPPLNILNIYL